MNAYLFILNGEAILIMARSMNDAEQAIIAEYEDVSIADLKAARRVYTRGAGKPIRAGLVVEVDTDGQE